MSIVEALVLAAVFCLWEARNCEKRAKLWDTIVDLEERIENMKAGRK